MPFPSYRTRFADLILPKELDFPVAEYRRRLAAVHDAMARQGIDLLIVGSLPDICWLTGFQTPSAGTFAALMVPAGGDPVLHAIDHEYACAMYTSWLSDIRTYPWFEPQTGERQHAQIIAELLPAKGRLAIDGKAPIGRDRLPALLSNFRPGTTIGEAASLVPQLRRIKSPLEIEAMRESGRISRVCLEDTIAALRPGMTDSAVAAILHKRMIEEGAEFSSMGPFVATGLRSSLIHTTWKRRPIESGDLVFLEVGPAYKRYNAPMMRTAAMGPPSALALRLTAAVEDTVNRLMTTIRAGRTGHEIALEAAKGFAPIREEIFFQGAFGYAVGLALPADWAEGSTPFIAEGIHEPMAAGMTLHMPIAARVVGKGGVALSETVLVTETGCESLTAQTRALAIVS